MYPADRSLKPAKPENRRRLNADDSQPPRRPIRSYVLRAGRMGPGQQRALDELGPRFVLPFAAEPLDFAATFGRDAPTVLEIGFGMGDATAQIAAALPDTDFIGVEVHAPGVGALLQRIGEARAEQPAHRAARRGRGAASR